MRFSMNIKKLNEKAIVPTYGSACAAGADLYACEDGAVTIGVGETVLVHTGIAMAIPEGYVGLVYARSGLSSKEGLRPANCVGVCDEDYRGEYIVALHNDSDLSRTVKHGDRIAQIILQKRYDMDFEEVDELDETQRGEGGFGSTGRR